VNNMTSGRESATFIISMNGGLSNSSSDRYDESPVDSRRFFAFLVSSAVARVSGMKRVRMKQAPVKINRTQSASVSRYTFRAEKESTHISISIQPPVQSNHRLTVQ